MSGRFVLVSVVACRIGGAMLRPIGAAGVYFAFDRVRMVTVLCMFVCTVAMGMGTAVFRTVAPAGVWFVLDGVCMFMAVLAAAVSMCCVCRVASVVVFWAVCGAAVFGLFMFYTVAATSTLVARQRTLVVMYMLFVAVVWTVGTAYRAFFEPNVVGGGYRFGTIGYGVLRSVVVVATVLF